MKATVNKENYRITLDDEAVKAIRFCTGFTTDLRTSLSHASKDSLWNWISSNEINLFGSDMLELHVDVTDPNWNKYDKMLMDVVRQVVR